MGVLLVLQYFPSFLNEAWNYAFLHLSSIRILIMKYLKRKIILNEYPNTQKGFSIQDSPDTQQRMSAVSSDLGRLSQGILFRICLPSKSIPKNTHYICSSLCPPSNLNYRICGIQLWGNSSIGSRGKRCSFGSKNLIKYTQLLSFLLKSQCENQHKHRSSQPSTSSPLLKCLIFFLPHQQRQSSSPNMAYILYSTQIFTDLLASSLSYSNILIKQSQLCLKGTIANANHPRKAIRTLFDVALFTCHIVVWVSFRNSVLVFSFAEATKNALETIRFLLHEVMSALKFSRPNVSFSSQLHYTCVFFIDHPTLLIQYSQKGLNLLSRFQFLRKYQISQLIKIEQEIKHQTKR